MPKPKAAISDLRDDDPRLARVQMLFRSHRPDEGRALLVEIRRRPFAYEARPEKPKKEKTRS